MTDILSGERASLSEVMLSISSARSVASSGRGSPIFTYTLPPSGMKVM